MRIVFWQNCLSPHQLPYIIHLLEDARVNKVVIVAEETINKSRKDMGHSFFPRIRQMRCICFSFPPASGTIAMYKS